MLTALNVPRFSRPGASVRGPIQQGQDGTAIGAPVSSPIGTPIGAPVSAPVSTPIGAPAGQSIAHRPRLDFRQIFSQSRGSEFVNTENATNNANRNQEQLQILVDQ